VTQARAPEAQRPCPRLAASPRQECSAAGRPMPVAPSAKRLTCCTSGRSHRSDGGRPAAQGQRRQPPAGRARSVSPGQRTPGLHQRPIVPEAATDRGAIRTGMPRSEGRRLRYFTAVHTGRYGIIISNHISDLLSYGIRTPDLLHAMRIRYVGLGRMESGGESPAWANSPGTSRRVGGSLNTLAPVSGSPALPGRTRLPTTGSASPSVGMPPSVVAADGAAP
jgi:hypothetical protein